QGFAEMLNPRQHNKNRFQHWITTVRATDLFYLHSFTRGLAKDEAAIVAGLTQTHSNGPTEGNVNRIKMIKDKYTAEPTSTSPENESSSHRTNHEK
ncbi:transposase, partial [Sciscionella marina]|uniref:transposase n=1 Tax=Sciscionella marina TaxID=508770 RepID=UPI00146D6FE1